MWLEMSGGNILGGNVRGEMSGGNVRGEMSGGNVLDPSSTVIAIIYYSKVVGLRLFVHWYIISPTQVDFTCHHVSSSKSCIQLLCFHL